MAFCSLGVKVAVALRGVAITAFLGIIKYVPTDAITPQTQANIKGMYGYFPVIFIIVSLIPYIFYKLDDKKLREMEADIAARKNQE